MLRLNSFFYVFAFVAVGIIISSISGYIIYSSEDIARDARDIAVPFDIFTNPFSNTTPEDIVSNTWPVLVFGLVWTGISLFAGWILKRMSK